MNYNINTGTEVIYVVSRETTHRYGKNNKFESKTYKTLKGYTDINNAREFMRSCAEPKDIYDYILEEEKMSVPLSRIVGNVYSNTAYVHVGDDIDIKFEIQKLHID